MRLNKMIDLNEVPEGEVTCGTCGRVAVGGERNGTININGRWECVTCFQTRMCLGNITGCSDANFLQLGRGLNVASHGAVQNNAFASQRRLHPPQVKKRQYKVPRGNSSRENQNGGGSMPNQDLFPLQFEDLFILSLGMIDSRPSYHNINQIRPVGYKTCWHDKISGSIFISEVLDGGNAGPIYRVQRSSCSALPIPVGSTVLSRKNPTPSEGKEKVSNNGSSSNGINNDDYDEILSIHMILNEDTPPNLGEIDFRKKASSSDTGSKFVITPKELDDCIGEFSVESRSSSMAWQMISRALFLACHMAYIQKGSLQLGCKHNADRVGVGKKHTIDSLSRFCCHSGPIDNIPKVIVNNTEFVTGGRFLVRWIEQDRFGLDVEFVQELLEKLPGSSACLDYISLKKRGCLQTVQSGFLLVKRKSNALDIQIPDGVSLAWKKPRHLEESAYRKSFPLGKPFSKLPPFIVGDVLQVWEFLWRFSEVLSLKESFSFEELEREITNPWMPISETKGTEDEALNWEIASCTGVALKKINCSLLAAARSELLMKWKKKDLGSSELTFDMFPINELTWPEVARRYILVFLSSECNLDSAQIDTSVGNKIFHCLQGDGGTLCGSLTGVSAMEADALLLAEAQKQVFGLPKNNEILSANNQQKPEAISSSTLIEINDDEVPKWAQVMEPVRKLPTNVGARIRRLVNQALELRPPDWARKILERSISKEVYKGNASGPTKRAVVALLDDISGKDRLHAKPVNREISARVRTFSELLMKHCRIVLRRVAAQDDKRVFCNLLGKTLCDNDNEGLLGSPAAVSRPLDFRVIDCRLAAGAYAGSHEAFREDVCEMLKNIRSIYSYRSDVVKLIGKLSQKFKDMYEKEVLLLVQKLPKNSGSLCITDENKREMDGQLLKVVESSLPKAPWEDGICKVCGVDKDDDKVLLCDGCDSEYHTYCLKPPLPRIPEGNWYCTSCGAGPYKPKRTSRGSKVVLLKKKEIQGNCTRQLMETLSQLAQSMGSKDFWNFNKEEITLLLKFLCDETLNTKIVRDHVDHCESVSTDLKKKLHSLCAEWKKLKAREEGLSSILVKSKTTVGESAVDGSAQGHSGVAKSVEQQLKNSSLDELNICPENPEQSSLKSKCSPDKSPAGENKQNCEGLSISDQGQQQEEVKGPCQEELSSTTDDQNLVSSNKSKTEMPHSNDGSTLKKEICAVKEAISLIENTMGKTSLRKEFLGRDSSGRIYWGFGRLGSSLLLVDRSEEIPCEEFDSSSRAHCVLTSGWISYQSDGEISDILQWLDGGEPRDKELRGAVLKWQSKDRKLSLSGKQPNGTKTSTSENWGTKAAEILKKRFGKLGLDLGETSGGNNGKLPIKEPLSRCNCLEPLLPSKIHCGLCHKTHSTKEELDRHFEGNCLNLEEEAHRGKQIVSEPSSIENDMLNLTKRKSQGPDSHHLKEGSKLVFMGNSLTEMVSGIGFVGSSLNTTFQPRLSGYLDARPKAVPSHMLERDNFLIRRHGDSTGGSGRYVIPEVSLRRRVSRECTIMTQLKIHLLDMDAALPEEAWRLSMNQTERRIAWRSFVKSAESIYQMVQATIVLENMIRAEYLRREWWYSSSLSAAKNISTLSALALRILTLDSAIMYAKTVQNPDAVEVSEPENKEDELVPFKSDKGKEKAPANKPKNSPIPKGRANKRRKESKN